VHSVRSEDVATRLALHSVALCQPEFHLMAAIHDVAKISHIYKAAGTYTVTR
jgi:hypothetical protein